MKILNAAYLGTSGVFFIYLIYLVGGIIVGFPSESYLALTRPVSEKAEAIWNMYSKDSLKCLVTDEMKLGPSPVLWIKSSPAILPLAMEKWTTEKRIKACQQTGGVAIKFVLDERFPVEKKFPNACTKNSVRVNVGTIFNQAAKNWEADIFLIPSNTNPTCPELPKN